MSLRAALANRAWLTLGAPAHLAFRRALGHPREVQESLLRRCLRRNADTRFGREHGFAAIHSVEEYQRRVPPRGYDELRGYLEAIARGEPRVLTGERVTCLQPTGGSTAGCKWIPLTGTLQREFRHALAPWLADLCRTRPGLIDGRAYWSITPAIRRDADPAWRVPAGYEDDADYLGGLLKPVVGATLAVPGDVARLGDPEEFRQVTLLHLLHARDLALVSVWHPTFLTLLLGAMEPSWDELLRTMARGLRTGHATLDLPPAPARAAELARLGPGAPARLWPRLALISCWGDASAALHVAPLRRLFPDVEIQPKGLIATEAFVSLPYAGRHPLAVTSHFFEFEDPAGRIRPAWALDADGVFSVLVTNGGGLYRYRLHDRVQVTSLLGATPCLRFLGKEDRISDRRGEKLDEAFVGAVIGRLLAGHGLEADFAMLAPETGAELPRYVLYLAPRGPLPSGLDAALETALGADPQYAYAVRLGQLAPAEVRLVGAGASQRCLERLHALGARLGDIKPAALSALDGWGEWLA